MCIRDSDYVIPANDDSTQAIELIISAMCQAINEGQVEYKAIKAEKEAEEAAELAPDVYKRQLYTSHGSWGITYDQWTRRWYSD